MLCEREPLKWAHLMAACLASMVACNRWMSWTHVMGLHVMDPCHSLMSWPTSWWICFHVMDACAEAMALTAITGPCHGPMSSAH